MTSLNRNCPDCGNLVSIDLLGLRGDLGPSLYRCNACGCVISSGKTEWCRLSVMQRRLLLASTMLLASVLAVVNVLLIALVQLLVAGTLISFNTVLVVLIGSALIVWLAQGYRIFHSFQRDAYGAIEPFESSCWSFESNDTLMIGGPLLVTLFVLVISQWVLGSVFG